MNKTIKLEDSKFLQAIWVILHPSYWLMNHTYSKSIDEWVNEALKNPTFTNLTEYRVRLNGKGLWIKNRPYGFEISELDSRPSRYNIYRVYEALNKSIINS